MGKVCWGKLMLGLKSMLREFVFYSKSNDKWLERLKKGKKWPDLLKIFFGSHVDIESKRSGTYQKVTVAIT